MIAVKVREVVLDSEHNPLLLLVDLNETMVLPIGIGFWEAQAIALKMQRQLTPRPMTHDLIRNLCAELGAVVQKIVVTDLKESTFYAEIHITDSRKQALVMDARPSDAVALALTIGCPIFISSKIAVHTIAIKDLLVDMGQDPQDYGDPEDGGPHLH